MRIRSFCIRAALTALFVLLCAGTAQARTLETVQARAFYGNAAITEVTLPDTVRSIDAQAFADCTALKKLVCYSREVTVDDSAFEGCEGLTVYCYMDSGMDAYAQAHGLAVKYFDAFTIVCDTEKNGCAGLPITWSVDSAMQEGSRYTCRIYDGDELKDSFENTTDTQFSYTPSEAGTYRAKITIQNERTTTTLGQLNPVPVREKLLMGIYEQDGDEETEDALEWRVLTAKDGKALLLTDRVIRSESYFNPAWIQYKNCSWEKSLIGTTRATNNLGSGGNWKKFTVDPNKIPLNRKGTETGTDDDLYYVHARYWCNQVFYETAFTEEERSRILLTHNINADNPDSGIDGGADTDDYVFFLSLDEVREYLPTNESRKALRTKVADREAVHPLNGTYCLWWLRTPGQFLCNAVYVLQSGVISTYGSDVGHHNLGYRPAMWITIGG